ncbi:rhodanese-like domain-containing protein [Streptomyces sp. DG2A-72]|uniref:rhodanese-like domain-containing protein n=1 Tax=Streptomyces sp. DG2A-72 TaxID=3051386 RepID=UPI00265BBD73|nr:rhodanese-like domain-containing protein [Streptomyces sp. DG2A-72]MDO0938828.1 rhodanese-like domain-containing protein [Streptomyces sp. DG2A-72]
MSRLRYGPGRITASEAAHRTHPAATATSVLLDVRETDEWQAGHAPWAIHLPLSTLSSQVRLPPEARDRHLVVICRSGNRSRQAAELLTAQGAGAVDVIGGMRDWATAGLPVVDQHGEDGTVT